MCICTTLVDGLVGGRKVMVVGICSRTSFNKTLLFKTATSGLARTFSPSVSRFQIRSIMADSSFKKIQIQRDDAVSLPAHLKEFHQFLFCF